MNQAKFNKQIKQALTEAEAAKQRGFILPKKVEAKPKSQITLTRSVVSDTAGLAFSNTRTKNWNKGKKKKRR